MTQSNGRVCMGVAALLYLGVLLGDAHAYLDPGTGSYIFQMLIASVVGGLFALKMYWRKLKESVRRMLGRKGGTNGSEQS